MLDVADLKAQTTGITGEGEAAISKVMASRRKYEHLEQKLKAINGFKNNRNVKVFGESNDDVISQMAAYGLASSKKSN